MSGIEIQNMKVVPALQPEVLNNGSGTAVEVDATGYHHAKFFFVTGTMAASSNISVAKVQAATTSGGAFADITGAALTSGDLDAGTDDAVAAIEIDLRDYSIGRFLQLVVTESGSANAPIAAVCVLSRKSGEGLNSAADRGLEAEVSV